MLCPFGPRGAWICACGDYGVGEDTARTHAGIDYTRVHFGGTFQYHCEYINDYARVWFLPPHSHQTMPLTTSELAAAFEAQCTAAAAGLGPVQARVAPSGELQDGVGPFWTVFCSSCQTKRLSGSSVSARSSCPGARPSSPRKDKGNGYRDASYYDVSIRASRRLVVLLWRVWSRRRQCARACWHRLNEGTYEGTFSSCVE